MMALAYLGAAALYFSLMFFVVRFAWRKGKAHGRSTSRAIGFACVGFLAVYLPLFWNWIPVVLTHRSLCNKEAGFTAYVTPEQWVAENRDQLQKLVDVDLEKVIDKSKPHDENAHWYKFYGGMLQRKTENSSFQRYGMTFRSQESKLIDVQTGKVLTKGVSHSVGSREDIRLWLHISGCVGTEKMHPVHEEIIYRSNLQKEIQK
jgi:hypothetical protein